MPRGRFSQDLTGQQFSRWAVAARTNRKAKNGSVYWSCQCTCGSKKEVATHYLTSGRSKSCGCFAREVSRKRLFKTGISYDRKTPEYKKYQRECFDRCRYNLEPDHKQAILDRQHGGCAVCEYKFGQKTGDMHVDHDHTSGAVRGLLCDLCNRGLGYFKDNPKVLEQAAKYIKTARAR